MLDYISTKSTLHTRGLNIGEKEYLFALNIVLGERVEVAYGMVYDTKEFKGALDTEDEEEYLSSVKDDAEAKAQLQEIRQLIDMLETDYKAEVQAKAMNIEDYSFTAGQAMQILQNLLKNRTEDISNSSVKDIIALINTLANQGALGSTNDNFENHFIHIYPPFDVLCSCNREFSIVKGIDGICPHCHKVYKWDEEQKRFFPQPTKL